MTSKQLPMPVVAGIFHRHNPQTQELEVLLFQRSFKDENGAGLFEFPGGKVERGESDSQALMREMMEEINIRVKVGKKLGSSEFEGTKHNIRITVYFVEGPVSEIKLLEHESMKWSTRRSIVQDEIALGDRPLMDPCFDELEILYGKK